MSDYIKREDALKAADDIVCDADDAERTCDRIIDLPSADVAQVRHGRWIESTTDLICSACDTVFNDEIAWMCRDLTYGYPRYCPYCGAKMDEEVD